VKSSTNQDDTSDEDENADDEDEDEDGDQVYKRIQLILEGLLDSGRRALETTTADFSKGAKGVAKVLNAEEVRTWRDSSGGTPNHTTHTENIESGEEVESIMLPGECSPQSPTPPILITESL